MFRILGILFAAILAGGVCAGLVVLGTLEGWWRQPIAKGGDTAAFVQAAGQKLEAESRGNYAFLQLERWQVVGEHYGSKGRPVDRDTQFQVASLSKWVTALGVMRLVEDGKVDLDAPVSRYLNRWALPPSKFNHDGVTVRRVLSHMAGLTDGLGYGGFKPGASVQTLPQSLTRASDASPGRDGITRVGQAPGEGWVYSGGGYTLLQLMIEDVTGQSFEDFMQAAVFRPLNMTRSSFLAAEDAPNLAEFFDQRGGRAIHYKFTALAAASLYTSVGDLAKLMQAHRGSTQGFLSERSLRRMRQPEASQFGAEIWGLGTILYAPTAAGGYVIGHDGSNAPAINTTARLDPESGDGVIVLVTGHGRLATVTGGEWVFWRTGKVDFLAFLMGARETLVQMAVVGGAGFLITLVTGFVLWRPRRYQAV
jgi:CubicO group peptidase (beta-lactamase class C family)